MESSLTFLFSHIPHPIHQQALPLLPLKHIQNPATSHHFHCYHPDLSHRHVLPKLNWAPYFCSWSLKSILCTHPEQLRKLSEIRWLLCLTISHGSPNPLLRIKVKVITICTSPYSLTSFLATLLLILFQTHSHPWCCQTSQRRSYLSTFALALPCPGMFLPRYPHCSLPHLLQVPPSQWILHSLYKMFTSFSRPSLSPCSALFSSLELLTICYTV